MTAPDTRKYVFVCGLHRSGTTVLAQNLGKLKDSAVFENTGVTMDEGQFLQDVYPPDPVYGGVGRFGFAPEAHLTEASPLLTPANIARLRTSWEKYWGKDKTICVEKTPGNLVMTRFLQAAFGNAYFIVLKRHPIATSLATQKWSRTSLHSLFDHWLRCHEIFDQDKAHLSRVYELTYEDYIKDPNKYLREMAEFIGSEPLAPLQGEVSDAHNKKYFDRWSAMLTSSPLRTYYRHIARKYEKKFAAHKYSLMSNGPAEFVESEESAPGRAIGSLFCVGADICAIPWRAEGILTYKIRGRGMKPVS